MKYVTLRILKDTLYSKKNQNPILVFTKAAIDLNTDILFFKRFFKDTSEVKDNREENFLLTGSNTNRNISNLMNGHCYDGKKGVGLKWFLAKPLADFQMHNELLMDFVSNVSEILIEYNCDFGLLTAFMERIVTDEVYCIPISLREYLLGIIEGEPSICLAWLLLLGLWGPDDILKLSEYWFQKSNFWNGMQPRQYSVNSLEKDNSFFVSEYPADGGLFALGSEIRHTWILKNIGSVVWEDRHLGCINGIALGYSKDSLNVDIPTTQPGEEVHLTIHMITPPDEGSYELYWKVMDKDNNLLFPDLEPVGIHFTVMPYNVLVNKRKLELDLNKLVPVSSCGKEDTITALERTNQGMHVCLNFEPVRIRPEIPDWLSVSVMLPPTDYSDMQYMVFDICSTDLSIKEIQFAVNPFKKEWMCFKYSVSDIDSDWRTIRIPISLAGLRILKVVEELSLLTNTSSFANQDNLVGSYWIRNVHFE